MIELLLAGALMTAAPQPQASDPQIPPPADAPVRLEDIEVRGRPLESMVRDFVRDVAAPNRGRNLAKWDGGVCVGVAQLAPETAQYVVDRVSTVATDLGLRAGEPGCAPNILVVASSQPDQVASGMVEARRRVFMSGNSTMHQSQAALARFTSSDRPVRWWAVSVPTDSNTKTRAVRVPGECESDCTSVYDMAPVIAVNAASSLNSQIVDYMRNIVVIVDAGKLDGITSQQLADYVAMVSLAQINPDASTSAYASILNIFENPDYSPSLTDWDTAYLQGLYANQRTHKAEGSNRSEVMASIRRAHSALRQNEPNQD